MQLRSAGGNRWTSFCEAGAPEGIEGLHFAKQERYKEYYFYAS
ncbi:MAG: hypothetical protein SPL54_09455 [Lachnospiraceae bacterium]|nr:hypothetical protein [Lachnospiraceae bacterium]